MNRPRNKIHFWGKESKKTISTTLVIVVTILFSVVLYSGINTAIKAHNNKQEFLELSKTLRLLSVRLQEKTSEEGAWSSEPVETCNFTFGSVMKAGSWYCESSLTFISSGETSSDVYITKHYDVLRESFDLVDYPGSSSREDSLYENINGSNRSSSFKMRNTGMLCNLAYRKDSGTFWCGGHALKSWYKNSQANSIAPGKDAWKE